MDPISKFMMDHLLDATAEILIPVMLITFVVGVVTRILLYYVAACEQKFTKEFEKRVQKALADQNHSEKEKVHSFHKFVRAMLEKSYYETFETKHRYKRRNFDYVTSFTDRVFLIQEGVARLVQDTLKQIRYLKRDPHSGERMGEITRSVFDNNPYFNRLMGVFPTGLLNELLNILPGLFIIGGIFGTFLGISKGLPELGNMDLSHLDETKKIMDMFLAKIGQSMLKSIMGIGLSVFMSLLNTILSPEGMYYNLINRYSSTLENLWNETTTNDVDKNDPSSHVGHASGVAATTASGKPERRTAA